ncbi:FG-GAP-like repeat-containing protein [Flavivirga spongiicola]|uniref:FG-GAP-like repeat-containing protein n=1 Tax=Flavivirga spongiicola TaxID=421621 RepID=A0ABU7XQH2_9FLAO|nr:FG-GAP-like repeat-containing protein [Flavivirga sp. MEBiC05379]MDO5977820.1 FG-GAP-like repeat-containing protein [Flavivirga sp. MEBiC05379]
MKKIVFLSIFLIWNTSISQTFQRLDQASGIDHVFDEFGHMGGGCVFFDYNNDGWEDLYLTSGLSKDKLYRNLGNGTFVEVPSAGFEITKNFYTTAAVSGDINNDGYRDLFVTTWNGKGNLGDFERNLLFINNGNGTFSERGLTSGLLEKSFTMGASLIDYNKDSFLDIYAVNYIKERRFTYNAEGEITGFDHDCFENLFYENNGDGTFTEKSAALGIDNSGCALAVIPTDFDQDDDQDLYIANDFGAYILSNALYQNNYPNASFSDVSSVSQTNVGIYAMGIAYGDIDKDSDFDYYVTNLGRNVLLENNGSSVFLDITANAAVENTNTSEFGGNALTTGWGTAFLDINNDSWLDLFVANGRVPSSFLPTGESDPNKLYLNNGDSTFSDISTSAGIDDPRRGRGMAYCDFDKDGDLDIMVVVQEMNGDLNSKSTFFVNQLNPNNSNDKNWVQFNLEGVSINKDAMGAKVILTVNGEKLIQEVHGQGSHCSQHSLVLHFGLAANTVIDSAEIIWSSSSKQTFLNVETNHRYILKEGDSTLQIDENILISGCTDPNSCNYNPLATLDDGSCEYLASNEILGASQSAFNKIETYNYTPTTIGSQLKWTIEGGELLSGQNTNSISVKWGLHQKGSISVVETDGNCNSLVNNLDVILSVANVSENISVARIWNEALLEAIRNDYARPTVHARNLFHTSVALYDVWAVYNKQAKPYLLGNKVNNFQNELTDFTPAESHEVSIRKAMSYAVYRLLTHRFQNSPGAEESLARFDMLMEQLGYDSSYTSTSYLTGNAADFGNYVGQVLINYGLSDNSRESSDYDNSFYEPANPPIVLNPSGQATNITNPNRWQPLTFNTFIDQSGNLIPGSTPEFLSPEWGSVSPFALSSNKKTTRQRNGNDYVMYHDPEMPPQLNTETQTVSNEQYKWNFSLVSLWSSHLDPSDGILWDVSPKSIGNIDINLFPKNFKDYPNFYDTIDGGDISIGHSINPVTNQPYETQMVPRADYARVLAEFWADGPDSETPPGHWFTILNYVTDHTLFTRKFNGEGNELNPLEWDVKAYFILGGALHDSAITAWGIKGWYDYIRPISAIRHLCELGQSTDESLANYNPAGIPLENGFIEVVEAGDELSGANNEHVGKIKVYAWRGHDFINNPESDVAGVGWILAENWWPYQRPSFVTPPFSGYVSGHSTFSRAAAEVMTLITGDAFFPGGMGEFIAKKDEFLVFEKGPSVDVKLQWATYRDASDQTSLSRIWGGIHPPADDIPGRLIGEQIGIDAYNFAIPYFSSDSDLSEKDILIYPNPVTNNQVYIKNTLATDEFNLFDIHGRLIQIASNQFNSLNNTTLLKLPETVVTGLYILKTSNTSKILIVKN